MGLNLKQVDKAKKLADDLRKAREAVSFTRQHGFFTFELHIKRFNKFNHHDGDDLEDAAPNASDCCFIPEEHAKAALTAHVARLEAELRELGVEP